MRLHPKHHICSHALPQLFLRLLTLGIRKESKINILAYSLAKYGANGCTEGQHCTLTLQLL